MENLLPSNSSLSNFFLLQMLENNMTLKFQQERNAANQDNHPDVMQTPAEYAPLSVHLIIQWPDSGNGNAPTSGFHIAFRFSLSLETLMGEQEHPMVMRGTSWKARPDAMHRFHVPHHRTQSTAYSWSILGTSAPPNHTGTCHYE